MVEENSGYYAGRKKRRFPENDDYNDESLVLYRVECESKTTGYKTTITTKSIDNLESKYPNFKNFKPKKQLTRR